jgi:hypothetical protein
MLDGLGISDHAAMGHICSLRPTFFLIVMNR